MRTLLTIFFMVLAVQASSQNKLPDVFWLKCSFLSSYLIKVNLATETFDLKVPEIVSGDLCEDNDRIIFGHKCSEDKRIRHYFNKWDGTFSDDVEKMACEVLNEEQQPLFQ